MSGFRSLDPPSSPGWLAEMRLTPREREVARGIFRWGSIKATAAALHLATGTVNNHLRAVHQKLDVASTFEVAYALWLRDPWGER